jgi:hypothetical protein
MTFGVTSLLEHIWKHDHLLLKWGLKPMPETIELCSVLERTLAYVHTENAKVLVTSLMRPFWLVQSLLQQGIPMLSTKIWISSSPLMMLITVSPADWPTLTDMRVPAISSKQSQILTYSQGHFEVSCFMEGCFEYKLNGAC